MSAVENAASELVVTRCATCGRPFLNDEAPIVVMKHGTVVAAYHESCRPDRRRNGCAGC